LLYIKEGENFKIYVPTSMIGLLISYTHLHGHWGVAKMLANMKMYYFPNMHSTVKKFVSCCYACFLQNSSSRQNVLGLYPSPEHPFQEISMDLCENLNKINGYSHLLVIQDVLTDFLLVFPLKSKESSEMARIFMYSVLQNFNIKRIHTDNGPVFRHSSWLNLMASLNITIINSSSQNPAARGKAEKAVHIVKTMLKKITAVSSSGTLNWECLPFIVTKIFNHTVIPRTGFTPVEMIFGKTELSKSQLALENVSILHHSIENNTVKLDNLSKNLKDMSKIAQETLNEIKRDRNEYANKNRVEKVFNENDIVFVLDRYNIPGNSRPLKTKFYASPCVVVKPYHTTTLVQRIADGFKSLYSNNDLKLFKGGNPFFKSLPKKIKNVLLHDFQDLLEPDFNTITKLDPLNAPPAISLTDTVEKNSFSSPNLREGHAASYKNKSRSPQNPVTDPDLHQKNLNTEPTQDKTTVLENKSDLKNESDSENEDENVADPEPDP
jgi:transposase InsO family protein